MSTPLATVGSIKVKLGLLVAASVVVAMVVSNAAYHSGVPLLLAFPVTRRARPGRHPAARRRHDLAPARDDGGGAADGPR